MNNNLNSTQNNNQTNQLIFNQHKIFAFIFSNFSQYLFIVIIFCGFSSIIIAQNGQQPPRVTGEGSENISLYSGRLNFKLPLIPVSGRGNNSTGLNLRIKEKSWSILETNRVYDFNGNLVQLNYGAVSNYQNPEDYGQMSLSVKSDQAIGSYFLPGTLLTTLEIKTNDGNVITLRDDGSDGQPRVVQSNIMTPLDCSVQMTWVINPNGTVSLAPTSPPPPSCSRGKVFHSSDGSAMTFVADADIYDAVYYDLFTASYLPVGGYGIPTGTLYSADGTKYRFELGLLAWSEDRNGNRTTFSYADTPYGPMYGVYCSNLTASANINSLVGCKLAKITDSIGREVNIIYGDSNQESYYDTISYKGFGGGERLIKIYYGRMGNSLAPGENLETPDNLFPIPTIYPNIPNAYNYSENLRIANSDPNLVEKNKNKNKTPREKSLDEIEKYQKKTNTDKEIRHQQKLLKNPSLLLGNPNIPKEVTDKLRLALASKKKQKTKSGDNATVAQLRRYCDPEIDWECGGGGDPDPTPFPTPDPNPTPTPTPFPTVTPTPPSPPIGNLFNPMVAQKVVLPDGQEYQFKYNKFGELARTIVPTGGYTDYEYGPLPNPRDELGITNQRAEANGLIWASAAWRPYEAPTMIYRRVAQQKNYDFQGSLQSRTDFGDVGYLNPVTVKTFEPNGTAIQFSKHHFFQEGIFGISLLSGGYYPSWKINREFKTEIFDPNNPTNPLRISETKWEQRATINWVTTMASVLLITENPENNPRVTETKTTLETGQVSLKTFNYDQYNNPTDTYEYDFGASTPGAFLRRSHTDYVTDANYTSYTGAHLRRLPLQSWVSSDLAGANKVSLSQNEYDNYLNDSTHSPLLGRTGVIGHNSTNYGVGNPWRGNVTRTTSFANAASQSEPISVFSQYDILGNPVKVIDAKGNVATVNYADNFGSPDAEARSNFAPTQLNGSQTYAFATSGTNQAGWTTYSQYDYFTGSPVDSEDILGVVSSNFYNDLLDRPTQTIAANNTNQRRQTTIVYDTANRRVLTTSDIFNFGDNVSKGEGFYDGLGRTREVRKYEENGGYIATLTEYDALSRVKRATNPFRPAQNEPQLWTTTNYDALGRAISVTTPDGATATTSYSGLIATATDQAGKQRRSVSNALGQLMRVDEPDDAGNLGSVTNPVQPTFYSYDTLGNLVKVTQGVQNRFFKYDSLGKMIRAREPEQDPNPNLALADSVTGNSQWTAGSTYDANGNALTTIDAKGVVITNTYDILNRPITRTYSDGTPAVTNAYDNPGIPYSKGKLTSTSNAISTTQVTAFDNLGRPLSSQQITDGQVYNFGYAYNLAGALIEETYPSGRKVKNTLEADGDLALVQTQKVGGAWETRADSFSYTSAGAVSSIRLGNNRWESTQFNARLQPTQIALGSGQNATDLLQLNYDYGTTDNNGNIKIQQISVAGQFIASQFYNYDSLNRLKGAEEFVNGNSTWRQVFTFDRYGNRKFDIANTTVPNSANPNITNPNIDLSSNRFTAGQGYVYDLAGNVIQDAQGRQFTFNGDNKQVEVRNSSNQIIGQYFYDSNGARIKKITNTETTVFVYSGEKLFAEYNLQGLTKEYVYAGSRMLTTEETSQTSYLTTDTLGSPRIVTDQNGNVQSRRDFMPFGEDLNNLGGRSQANGYTTDNIRQKFTAYEKDNETGLDFAEARYYNNLQGRFTAVDPLIKSGQSANPQTFNRYAYVANNPTNLTDSTGMAVEFDEFSAAYFGISRPASHPVNNLNFVQPYTPSEGKQMLDLKRDVQRALNALPTYLQNLDHNIIGESSAGLLSIALKRIMQSGNETARRIAANIVNGNVNVGTFSGQGSAFTEVRDVNALNVAIRNGCLSVEGASSFFTIYISETEFSNSVSTSAALEGSLLHEGSHLMAMAMVVGSISGGGTYDKSRYDDEVDAKMVSIQYAIDRGGNHLKHGKAAKLIDSSGKPNMPAVTQAAATYGTQTIRGYFAAKNIIVKK